VQLKEHISCIKHTGHHLIVVYGEFRISIYARVFNGLNIVGLLLYHQNRLFKNQRERLLCFLSKCAYQPTHLKTKGIYISP